MRLPGHYWALFKLDGINPLFRDQSPLHASDTVEIPSGHGSPMYNVDNRLGIRSV